MEGSAEKQMVNSAGQWAVSWPGLGAPRWALRHTGLTTLPRCTGLSLGTSCSLQWGRAAADEYHTLCGC